MGRCVGCGTPSMEDLVDLIDEWTSKNEQIDLVIDVSIAGETNTYVR